MSDERTPLLPGVVPERSNSFGRKWRRRRPESPPPLTHCENCGAPLTGPYCAQCGQPAIDYRRSFGSLLAEAADAFFNFDARFFQSFGLLLLKPWRLTNEFIEGKRARHVHPLRVYLIASVIFFLVINFLARDTNVQSKGSFSIDNAPPSLAPGETVSPSLAALSVPLSSPAPGAKPTPKPKVMFEDLDKLNDVPPFTKWIEGRAKTKIGPTGDRSDLFVKALIQNLAPMVLCCIPLFALVLKILYVFKRRFYIEHLVFALHTHAFVFLSTVVIIGIGFVLRWKAPPVLTPLVSTLLGLAVLVQLLRAIRKVYRQSWLATLFKFGLGSLIYLVLLGVAFGVTAFATLALP